MTETIKIISHSIHTKGNIWVKICKIAFRRSIIQLAIAGSKAVVRAAGARRHFVAGAEGNLSVALGAAVTTATGFFAGLNNVFVHYVILLFIQVFCRRIRLLYIHFSFTFIL